MGTLEKRLWNICIVILGLSLLGNAFGSKQHTIAKGITNVLVSNTSHVQ